MYKTFLVVSCVEIKYDFKYEDRYLKYEKASWYGIWWF